MRIRKKYLYFLFLVLFFSIVLDAKFIFSQKPSFEIAPSPGPTIQNTNVSPNLGLPGTVFTITTQASDVSGISSVIAHIQNPDETDVAQVILYDDGLHNDGAANDGTYGASWNSTGFPEATYYVDVVATDTLGYFTEKENGASFDIVTNFPPIADARVGNAPNPTGKRVSVAAGNTVYFDGSTYSSDPDGVIAKYEWDFESDGIYDWSSSITGVTTHVYPVGSGYTARLRVTDDEGATATDRVEIDRVLECACEAWINGSCSSGIFDDDFETYNLGNLHNQGGWSEYYGNTNWKVVGTKAYGGVKSAYIDRYNDVISAVIKTGNLKQSGVQSAWIYLSEKIGGTTIYSPIFKLVSDYLNLGLNGYGIKFNISTGKWEFVYQDGNLKWVVLNPNISPNEWHSIEAKFDVPNWRYQLRIDSGPWSNWIPFHNARYQQQIKGVLKFFILIEGQELWVDTIDGEINSTCLATQKPRTRTCKPAGCSTEFDCNGNAATCGGFSPPPSFDLSHKVLPGAPPVGGADWMSPVKNQGAWDASAFFASTGVMEGKYNIQKSNPNLDIDLSEQYMDACLGTSLLENMLRYTGGSTDEACLPYQAKSVPCSDRCSDWNKRLWDLTGVNIVGGNRDEIKYALINYGPLRVTMDMARWNPITYSCGLSASANHVAVIVGYDDTEGVWIVRNSWGPFWNGNGYFKVKYGECLIDDEAVAIDGLIAP